VGEPVGVMKLEEGQGRVRVEAWARLSVVAPGCRGETVEFHFYFHLN